MKKKERKLYDDSINEIIEKTVMLFLENMVQESRLFL